MARIRSIKPDFWQSATLASHEPLVVLTFLGLFNHVDDAGRCKDRAALVKAAVHPLGEEVSTAEVELHLASLATSGAICRFEHNGDRYLHLPHFLKHQVINRSKASSLPPCPSQDSPPTIHGAGASRTHTQHGAITDVSGNGDGALSLEGMGEEPEMEVGAGAAPTAAPIATTPTAQPAAEVESAVGDLVTLYTDTAGGPPADRVATLRKESLQLLQGGADLPRLRQAVLDLARKDVHPRALGKFLEHARLPSPPKALVPVIPVKSDQAWNRRF